MDDGDVQRGRSVKGLSDSADLSLWPSVDIAALAEEHRLDFLKRKHAVMLYLSGKSYDEIRARCGIGGIQVYRLIRERCLAIHPDGRLYGWRALIRNQNIKGYNRQRPMTVDDWGRGTSGALRLAFDRYPQIRIDFEKRILKASSEVRLTESKKPKKALWQWLLTQFRREGIEARGEWPFNTKYIGYAAIRRFVERTMENNPAKATLAIGGADLGKKAKAGDGTGRPVLRVFQRVEVDAHKLDGRFCVMVPQLDGDATPKIVHRLWVIVILEVLTRAVLGYYFSMGKEVSKSDVLQAIKMSLSKWKRKQITFSDEAYTANAALPSGCSDRFVGICYDEFSVDGALANTCKTVETQLRDIAGTVLVTPNNSYAVRRSKDDRPFIESFFTKLGKNGFQRMSNTTGGKASENLGKSGEMIAVTSQFQYEYAQELIDVFIANYNASPHTSLGNRSPLEVLIYLSGRGDFNPRYADPMDVNCIFSVRKPCTVKGGYKTGRRPYINFEGSRYSADWLDRRQDLVGEKIWAINDDEYNACVIMVSTSDGEILGHLRAHPPWHLTPHTLRVRKQINSLVARKVMHLAQNVDPVLEFLDFAESCPKGKLPIHPAYLEAREALVRSHQDVVDRNQLISEKIDALIADSRSSNPGKKSRSFDKTGSAATNATADFASTSPSQLPARRRTVVK
ncbi:hypothetical protein [Herbaspirillum huttiense]|uniref:hypothetical protein n=1 Tax=Herbaspirillum huttiense TaxID=863372 RepID=UPI0039B11F79